MVNVPKDQLFIVREVKVLILVLGLLSKSYSDKACQMRSIISNHTIALFQLTWFNYRQRRSLVNLPDWKNVLILDVLVKHFCVTLIGILLVKQIFERIWRVYIIYFLWLPIWYIVSNHLVNYKLQEINII